MTLVRGVSFTASQCVIGSGSGSVKKGEAQFMEFPGNGLNRNQNEESVIESLNNL